MKFVSHPARVWLVRWLYCVAVGHLLVAMVMSWFAESVLFTDYHQQVISRFGDAELSPLLTLQQWWIQLFGATLQAFAIFMLLLVYLGNRYADPLVWLALALTLLWWAPQDIYLSLQQTMWSHLWADLAALLAIVPAAIWLAIIDRARKA